MTEECQLTINDILIDVALADTDITIAPGSVEYRKTRDLLRRKFSDGFDIALTFRDEVLQSAGLLKPHKLRPDELRHYQSVSIATQYDLTREILEARSSNLIDQYQAYCRRYVLNRPMKKKPINKLTPFEQRLVIASRWTHGWHHWFEQREKEYMEFNRYRDQFLARNEMLRYQDPNDKRAALSLVFVREKSSERIVKKLFRKIMIEMEVARLQGRDFEPQHAGIRDYIAFGIGSKFANLKNALHDTTYDDPVHDRYIVPILFPVGVRSDVREWQTMQNRTRGKFLGSRTYYVTHRDFPCEVISFRFADITTWLHDDYASLYKHDMMEMRWDKLTEFEAGRVREAGGKPERLESKLDEKHPTYLRLDRMLAWKP